MKNNRIFSLTVIIVMLTYPLMSCVYSTNLGPTEDDERNVGDFDGIKVSTGIDVVLSQGPREKVLVRASEDIIDDVVTEVDNGVLKVYLDTRKWFNFGRVEVFITFVDIDMLDVSSGSDVEASGLLKFNEVEIEASSGSDIEMELEARSVGLRASSGSDANLKGTARNFTAKASSGSDIDAYDFEVENAFLECSSGSDISIWVTESLDVKASSGSDVTYRGDPVTQNINTSGGSDVNKRGN